MSKRKSKQTKPLSQLSTPQLRAQLKAFNQQLHTVNISSPMLVFVQRMANDPVFREKVTRLM